MELAREREMLNGMTDEERMAWVDAHWRSSVMGNGRILEVQLQSEWTSDTDADIKAAAFALEQVVERKGTGDDQICKFTQKLPTEIPHAQMLLTSCKKWFEDEMPKVRNAKIQHTEDLDKPMNEDETYIALHFAVYDKEICYKGRLLGHAQEVREDSQRHH